MNFALFKQMIQPLKKVETITVNALLLAMNTVLGFFTIAIGEFIKISFSFLTLSLSGMLYGPIISGIFGGLGDIINYMVKPTGPFFPGFTLNAILTGIIYGIAFFNKKITLVRTIVAKLTVTIFIDLLLSTYWLSVLYGQAFLALLPLRMLKSAIMLPINVFLLYLVLNRVQALLPKLMKKI